MIVSSAVVSHSPLLCPTSEKARTCQKTQNAFLALAQSLYAKKVETLLIISPHSGLKSDSLLVNVNPTYTIDLRQFGDYTKYQQFPSDIETVSALTSHSNQKELSFQCVSKNNLDYGTSIPLLFLGQNLRDIKIVPIYTCAGSPRDHLLCGNQILPRLHELNKRIAIIASVDLSKTISKGNIADGSFSFDQLIIKKLNANNLEGILDISEDTANASHSCAQKPFAFLAGILGELDYETKILSYETAHNSGLLIAEFHLA